ncbi:MAG: ABC transporter ATP-binding protein [candidate division NC10 bacterium]|nr:ABC transporter ATP-binding protein [candidate division NC10 bacterium]
MIRVEHLTYRYPGSTLPALQDVSLKVRQGECVLLTGETGAGKSTLICALNGLIPQVLGGVREGEVEVEGVDPARVPVKELAQRVGTVFQNPEHQIFMLRVWDDVAFGCFNRGFSEREAAEKVEEALRLMGLWDLRSREVFKLSGGQKQRLAIAGSYAPGPRIFLFEEPLTDLDQEGRSAFREMIASLKARGHTLIIAEHQGEELQSCADRTVRLHQGRVAGEGAPPLPPHPLSPFPRQRRNLSVDPSAAPLLIELWKLEVAFGDGTVGLKGVSLSFRRGEMAAICGPNGSGKTTLLKAIMGIVPSSGGEVRVLGRRASFKELIGKVAYLFQNPDDQLFAETVEEELSFGPHNLGRDGRGVEAYLDLFDLRDLRSRHPLTLSRGQRQRLAVASLLIMEPQILLLDEPTTGLDRESWVRLMEGIEEIHRRGVTVLFATHHQEIVERYAGRLIRLQRGEVVDDQVL